MDKVDEVKNCLTFYVLANKLKTTIIDEKNNYSVADNIFGSLILATAMDSEFKETDDLPKIYRMICLSQFQKLNVNYSFSKNLKKGQQFDKEVSDYYRFNTKDSALALKYQTLDVLLTKLITEKENILDSQELIKKGIKILSSKNGENISKYEEIFKFYYLNFKLKNKTRSGWDKKHWNVKTNRIERISEHIVSCTMLAMAMDSEFKYNINIDADLKTLVIHEIGESIIGDITPFDGITPEQKQEIEHKAMIIALGHLNDKEEYLKLLYEFDARNTNDSIYMHFIDKIESDIQAKIYQDCGLQNSLDNQQNNCVFLNSKVQQMVKDGAKTAFDIWYEWDKTIYAGNKLFPDFSILLKATKDNNLFNLKSNVFIDKVKQKESKQQILI